MDDMTMVNGLCFVTSQPIPEEMDNRPYQEDTPPDTPKPDDNGMKQNPIKQKNRPRGLISREQQLREGRRKYYHTHRKQCSEYQARYYRLNREKYSSWNAEYYRTHREESKARFRKFYQLHREEIIAKVKARKQLLKEGAA